MPLDVLKNHLMASHEDSTKKDEVEESLRLLSKLVPNWCQIKEIDSQLWFKIMKNGSIFCDVKNTILKAYDEAKEVQYKY